MERGIGRLALELQCEDFVLKRALKLQEFVDSKNPFPGLPEEVVDEGRVDAFEGGSRVLVVPVIRGCISLSDSI